jgi:hypothetical protein
MRAAAALAAAVLLLAPSSSSSSSGVGPLLDALRFHTPVDGGPVRSDHSYELVQLQSIYSEGYLFGGAEAVATGPWNTEPLHYLFQRDGGGDGVPCDANATVTANGNIPRGDLRTATGSAASSWSACAAACEADSRCLGWTYDCCNNSFAGSAGCYLKSAVSSIGSFHGDYAGCSARGVAESPSECCASPTHPNASYRVPPHGMRSAVSLGPVGGGSLELRADGRLADWRLLNNQPEGVGTKISAEGASFALHLGQADGGGHRHTTLLRTHSPEPNLPTVESMSYGGAFPASRLTIVDANITSQFAMNDPLRLFGVSAFKQQDPNASSIPSISFMVDVPPSNATEAAVMLSLPAELLGSGATVVCSLVKCFFCLLVFTLAKS